MVFTGKEVRGHWAAGQKPGDRAAFEGTNFGGRLCIHAPVSTMGKGFAMQQGIRFGWLGGRQALSAVESA